MRLCDDEAESMFSACNLARLVQDGQCSAVAVARDALDRAGELDGALRSFVELWPERALAAAREVAARQAAGDRLALAGVPIGLKAPGSMQAPQALRLIAADAFRSASRLFPPGARRGRPGVTATAASPQTRGGPTDPREGRRQDPQQQWPPGSCR